MAELLFFYGKLEGWGAVSKTIIGIKKWSKAVLINAIGATGDLWGPVHVRGLFGLGFWPMDEVVGVAVAALDRLNVPVEVPKRQSKRDQSHCWTGQSSKAKIAEDVMMHLTHSQAPHGAFHCSTPFP